jgi:hypothetical protein
VISTLDDADPLLPVILLVILLVLVAHLLLLSYVLRILLIMNQEALVVLSEWILFLGELIRASFPKCRVSCSPAAYDVVLQRGLVGTNPVIIMTTVK